jgi:prepilin-type N-terminal cleavage/methylation domain-containing protein
MGDFSHLKSKNGFSLIEIMVVLVIISALLLFTSSKMGTSNRAVRKEVRNFASSVRELRYKARMNNFTYRLVINLPDNKEEKQTYWVESTGKKFLLNYDEAYLKKEAEKLKDAEKTGKKDPSDFNIDSSISKYGPQPLARGLVFESVEIASQKKEFMAGRIYIHFFPEGRVEESVIHIGDGDKLHWSLAIHPLTGRVDMIAGDKKLKDIQQGI